MEKKNKRVRTGEQNMQEGKRKRQDEKGEGQQRGNEGGRKRINTNEGKGTGKG
jgi:hypothetical protein